MSEIDEKTGVFDTPKTLMLSALNAGTIFEKRRAGVVTFRMI